MKLDGILPSRERYLLKEEHYISSSGSTPRFLKHPTEGHKESCSKELVWSLHSKRGDAQARASLEIKKII